MFSEGFVRPANRFVTEGKRTKHTEYSYPITKLISLTLKALAIGLLSV